MSVVGLCNGAAGEGRLSADSASFITCQIQPCWLASQTRMATTINTMVVFLIAIPRKPARNLLRQTFLQPGG